MMKDVRGTIVGILKNKNIDEACYCAEYKQGSRLEKLQLSNLTWKNLYCLNVIDTSEIIPFNQIHTIYHNNKPIWKKFKYEQINEEQRVKRLTEMVGQGKRIVAEYQFHHTTSLFYGWLFAGKFEDKYYAVTDEGDYDSRVDGFFSGATKNERIEFDQITKVFQYIENNPYVTLFDFG